MKKRNSAIYPTQYSEGYVSGARHSPQGRPKPTSPAIANLSTGHKDYLFYHSDIWPQDTDGVLWLETNVRPLTTYSSDHCKKSSHISRNTRMNSSLQALCFIISQQQSRGAVFHPLLTLSIWCIKVNKAYSSKSQRNRIKHENIWSTYQHQVIKKN